jgi:excisionase family DNA binding protein
MDNTLMKIPEVARRLNCSVAFVYEIVAEGRLKHYVLGRGQGGKRVSEEHLQEYLRNAEHGGEFRNSPMPLRQEEVTFAFLPPPS